jgi:hypothetical protein
MMHELLRAAIHEGLGALQTLTEESVRRLSDDLPPIERWNLEKVIDLLVRRIPVWREFSRDEPELLTALDVLSQRMGDLIGITAEVNGQGLG